jgi:HPt (histidine-containing phosphotransfer) domain-containing protein
MCLATGLGKGMKMIDWKRVTELRDEIGTSEFDEVVELFLEEVDILTTRLRASPDPARYEEDMHFLKGCAVNLGFAELSRRCLEGETLAAAGQPERLDLGAVLSCCESSRTEFLEGLSAGLAA